MTTSAVTSAFEIYEITHHILSFLPGQDLYACNQVQSKLPINMPHTTLLLYALNQHYLESDKEASLVLLDTEQTEDYIPDRLSEIRALNAQIEALAREIPLDVSDTASWRHLLLAGEDSGIHTVTVTIVFHSPSWARTLHERFTRFFAADQTFGDVFDSLKKCREEYIGPRTEVKCMEIEAWADEEMSTLCGRHTLPLVWGGSFRAIELMQ